VAISANTRTVAETRIAVINRLLAELEDTVVTIESLTAEQREQVLVRDAEKITARVAQALSQARGQLGVLPVPHQLAKSSTTH
jgi:hypothetical protein